jgi:hypothetical protein
MAAATQLATGTAIRLGGTGVYDYVANKVADNYSIMDQLIVQATGVGGNLPLRRRRRMRCLSAFPRVE